MNATNPAYDASARHNVFVYGSLLSGLHNHPVINPTGAAQGTPGYTLTGQWTMHDLGAFPALRLDDAGGQVVGEVYAVDGPTMANLDRLEGFPRFYNRREVVVQTATGRVTCWVYYIADATRLRRCPRVKNNDWRRHYEALRSFKADEVAADAE